MIVPLFALANAGIAISGDFARARVHVARHARDLLRLRRRQAGRVRRRPAGSSTRLSRGRLRPPVGWAALAGGGTIAGIGFTVSLLIATLAFTGAELEEAKIGILSAALLAASLLTWLVFRATDVLPRRHADPRAARHARSRSSTSPIRSTPSATTSAARTTRR